MYHTYPYTERYSRTKGPVSLIRTLLVRSVRPGQSPPGKTRLSLCPDLSAVEFPPRPLCLGSGDLDRESPRRCRKIYQERKTNYSLVKIKILTLVKLKIKNIGFFKN